MKAHVFFRFFAGLEARTSRAGLRLSILRWFTLYRERAQLRDLSDDTLRDCGLCRTDIEKEIRRLS